MADARLITWIREYAAADELRGLAADDLWARVRDAGCGMAFRVVVERLGPRVMQICRGELADRHLAEDAFQDAFVLLFAKRAAIPTFAKANAWVRTTAGWTARRHRRTRRRKAGREQVLIDAAADPDTREPDEFDRLAAAVAALPAHYRRPLELVYYDDLTHKAAAAELGLTEGAVNSYVARGVAKLRAKLGATAVGLTAALAAPAPAVPREILARFAGPLPAATAGWGVGKLAIAGVLAAGTAAGGAGAWWGKSVPRPAPPPAAAAKVAAVAPEPETLPQRSIRVYRDRVLPIQLDELRKLVLGGGDVKLRTVEAFDSRIACGFDLNHWLDGKPWFTSDLRVVHQTATGETRLFVALMSPGKLKSINPDRPLVIWTDDLVTRKEVVGESPSLVGTVRAFDALPRDAEAAAAAADEYAKLERAAAPLLGPWYLRGDPNRPRQMEWIAAGDQTGLFLSFDGRSHNHEAFVGMMRLNPTGRLVVLPGTTLEGLIASPDGGRMSIADGTWWTREPRK